ncbi:GNAT family N-acetyltransferase [Agromyces sp. NPDC049794]|uniref:GNAT family N-acetyltransferase n=1 Tax=unclassified Agromyces TaxID=2639701 RepID=UPI0033E62F4C
MIPSPTARLRFREMSGADLDDMAGLLGDPEVMQFYPAPKMRDQAGQWIEWNLRNYDECGHGLWIVETVDGEFVGDCGLTWQPVNGVRMLEVGYHVRSDLQGLGYATEAAAACRDFARDELGAAELVAIIHPDNAASRRVAEKIGMTRTDDDLVGGIVRTVLSMSLR